MSPNSNKKYKCSLCNNFFASQSSVNRHQDKIHGIILQEKGVKCLENECKHTCSNIHSLITHLSNTHKKKFEGQIINFSSNDDFLVWKEKYEHQTSSLYTQKCGSKRIKDYVKTYYYCHRNGTFTSRSTGKRKIKSQGSSKTGHHCTSYILTEQLTENGKVKATIWKTHYGHETDVLHLRITNNERAEIAKKLQGGIPFNALLDTASVKVSDPLKVNRLDILSRKDLFNISKSFGIKNEIKKYSSIKDWIKQMEKLGNDNPVIFYKGENEELEIGINLMREDFCLILMTRAQNELLQKLGENSLVCLAQIRGLKRGDFSLFTLIVLDEHKEGFPVSFMITNRCDEMVIILFFEQIKTLSGQIKAKIFMTDETESFYTAWENVMGEVQSNLICSWHINKDWRKNLTLIKNKSLQASVYKSLKELLVEPNLNDFQKLLDELEIQLLENLDTEAFGVYFKENYSCCSERWAYWYRNEVGINANMSSYLEAFHRVLRFIYLKGKNVNRLDQIIHSVMNLLRCKKLNRINQLVKGKGTLNINTIKDRHNKSQKLKAQFYSNDYLTWTVKVEGGGNYIVENKQTQCNCNLRCSDCNICIHSYSCSCVDYMVRANMCKHIHFLITKFLGSIPDETECQDTVELITSVGNNEREINIESTLKDLGCDLEVAQSHNSTVSNEASSNCVNLTCDDNLKYTCEIENKRLKTTTLLQEIFKLARSTQSETQINKLNGGLSKILSNLKANNTEKLNQSSRVTPVVILSVEKEVIPSVFQ